MMEKQESLQVERDLANRLFAWLQTSGDELPPALNCRAKQLLAELSVTSDDLPQLRTIIDDLDASYVLPLRLRLSGFEESIVKQFDSQDVLGNALTDFGAVCRETISQPDVDMLAPAVQEIEPIDPPAVNAVVISPKRQGPGRSPKTSEVPRPSQIRSNGEPSELELAELSSSEQFEDVTEGEIEKLAGTRLDADLVKQYLREIGKFNLLNAEQEVMLGKGIEAGLFAAERLESYGDTLSMEEQEELEEIADIGKQYKELLINSNLRLVVSITKRYTGRGMLFLDLIQEGNSGLIRAVEKFDYTKGYKFSTYATWWIRQASTRALADQGRTIRLPVHAVEVINKIARFESQFLRDTGRDPFPSEIARELDISEDKVLELKKAARPPVSIHTPLGDDGDTEFGDLIEDVGQADVATSAFRSETHDRLNTVLETFTDREALVIRMRFGLLDGEPKTLDEIGQVIGLTKERVRQIEAKTLSKLRHPSRSHLLTGLQLTGSD